MIRNPRQFHENISIYIKRKYLYTLILGFIFLIGFVFMIGFWVGGRSERLLFNNQSISAIPIDKKIKNDDKLKFYTELTKDTSYQKKDNLEKKLKKDKVSSLKNSQKTKDLLNAIQVIGSNTSKKLSESDIKDAINSGYANVGEYTIQVSSFQAILEAKAYLASLKRKGFNPFIVTTSIPDRGIWHRVRLGHFQTISQAKKAKDFLAHLDIPAWILITK